MATIEELNALNIRPRTIVSINIYDSNNARIASFYDRDIIKVTASLRADLSRIGPTLPESDFEADIYSETDISDALADAGEELEIRYAWYPQGSGSFVTRYFYTDQRITWENKILHIHAVDQVHKLDEELPPLYIGQDWFWNDASSSTTNVLHGLALATYDFVSGRRSSNSLNIKHLTSESVRTAFDAREGTFSTSTMPEGGALNMLLPRMTRRDAIAKLMNLCRWDFDDGALNGRSDFWPTFVDAGRPKISFYKSSDEPITIKREDCGDVKESKEPLFSSITATVSDVNWVGAVDFDEIKDPEMTSRILKYQGITFDYNGGYGDYYLVGIPNDPSHPWGLRIFYIRDYTEDNNARKRPPQDFYTTGTDDELARRNQYGKWLVDANVATNAWTPEENTYSYLDLSGSKWYQPLDPDVAPNETPNSIWNECVYYEDIPEDAEAVDASNQATFFLPTAPKQITKSRAGSGEGYTIQDEMFLMGHAIMRRYDGTGEINLLPDEGINHILNMSNVVGSFTWKGDPRLQPRDVFTFVYETQFLCNESDEILLTESGDELLINEGTSEVCTIETITITHEKGGTISEITYRKGIC